MFKINNKDVQTTHREIECSQLICNATQMSAFHMMESHSGAFNANYKYVQRTNLVRLR